MIRKLTLALAATVALGAAALAPTTASAWPPHGHHGHHWRGGFGIGFYGPTYAPAPTATSSRSLVMTALGPRVRRVTVCD